MLLEGTPFRAALDATGVFTARDVLPGRYRLVVADAHLDSLAVDPIPTNTFVTVKRGEISQSRATIPSFETWLAERCARDERKPRPDGPPAARRFVLARLFDAERRPVAGADFTLETPDPSHIDGWSAIHDPVRTRGDGLFAVCSDALQAGQQVALTVRRGSEELGRVERPLADGVITLIAIFLKR